MANYSVGIFASPVNINLFGSSRNIYYLAKTLEAKGCQVTVFCSDSPVNKDAQVKKIYVPSSKWKLIPGSIQESFRIAKRAKEREGDFDIFHSNCSRGFPYAFRRNRPLVVHVRDIHLRTWQAARADSLFKTLPLYQKLYMLVGNTINWLAEKYLTRNSDLVFCNSEETATERILRLFPLTRWLRNMLSLSRKGYSLTRKRRLENTSQSIKRIYWILDAEQAGQRGLCTT